MTEEESIWDEIIWKLEVLQCSLDGHEFIDDDPGDPEVGPQPYVYCVKCGLEL